GFAPDRGQRQTPRIAPPRPAPPRAFPPACRPAHVRVSWADRGSDRVAARGKVEVEGRCPACSPAKSGRAILLPMKLRCLLLAYLVLAIAAAAVQPLYRVDAEVVFLPHDGIALNAHTGRVLWRFPRFDGEVLTDGHGLLIVGWVALIQPKLDRRITRF